MTQATPSLSGTFRQTPLLHLLVHVVDQHWSGTAVFETPVGRSAVSFNAGVPQKARLSDSGPYLADVVRDLGVVPPRVIDETLRRRGTSDKLHGELLMEAGALTSEQLNEALVEQLERKLLKIARFPADTYFGFYRDRNYLEGWGRGALLVVEPLRVLGRVACDGGDFDTEPLLQRLGSHPLSLEVSAPLARYHLGRRERGALDLMRVKPMTVAELLDGRAGAPEVVRRVIYLLAVTRSLRGSRGLPVGVDPAAPPSIRAAPRTGKSSPFHSQIHSPDSSRGATPPAAAVAAPVVPARAAPSATATPPHVSPPAAAPPAAAPPAAAPPAAAPPAAAPPAAAPPPIVDANAAAKLQELRSEGERLLQGSYYELLFVSDTVEAAAIGNAFLLAAKRWHPDRVPAELRDLAQRVFSRMNDARTTLADPDKRHAYDLKRSGASADDDLEQEQVARVLGAAQSFQRAEILLKRHAYAEAEKEARVAADGDPDQGDYLALLAHLVGMRSSRSSDETDDELLRWFDRAVELAPGSIAVRYYRGCHRKRMGIHRGALEDFRWVTEKNPHHVEAAREIRMFQLRNSSPKSKAPSRAPGPTTNSPPAPAARPESAGGFFARLRKK